MQSTTANPDRWSVQVPLAGSDETLTIAAEAMDGGTLGVEQAIENSPIFPLAIGAAIDASRNRALVLDIAVDALLAVDLATGDRSIVSDGSMGSGPAFTTPFSVFADAANGRALVLDAGINAVLAVDLSSGERSIISDSNTGAGPARRTTAHSYRTTCLGRYWSSSLPPATASLRQM